MDVVNIVYNGNKLEVKKLDKFHRLTILDIFKEKGVYKAKCKCCPVEQPVFPILPTTCP